MVMNTPPTGPTQALPTTSAVTRSEPLATWRVGQILAATVVAGAAAYLLTLYRVDRPAVRRLAGWLGLRRWAAAPEEVEP